MAKEQKNIIYLTDEEAEVFKWVMQNYKIFRFIKDIKPCKVVLNISALGKIKPEFSFFNDDGIDKFFGSNIIK